MKRKQHVFQYEQIFREQHNFEWGEGGLCIPVLEGRDLWIDKFWGCC
jgi:hypothetical protein